MRCRWKRISHCAIMAATMEQRRTTGEELAFKAAQLELALKEAGFDLALADPSASRDFSYRARYIRRKSTLFPRLQVNIEYYLATRSFSLKINADDPNTGPTEEKTYYCLIKNHTGDLKELLGRYFDSVRRGVPLVLGRATK